MFIVKYVLISIKTYNLIVNAPSPTLFFPQHKYLPELDFLLSANELNLKLHLYKNCIYNHLKRKKKVDILK